MIIKNFSKCNYIIKIKSKKNLLSVIQILKPFWGKLVNFLKAIVKKCIGNGLSMYKKSINKLKGHYEQRLKDHCRYEWK